MKNVCFVGITMNESTRMKQKKSLEDELFYIGLAALAVGTALAVLYQCVLRHILLPVPCFFSTILGIYCPGCGGTRALTALLRGRLLLSLWYHPLIPYGAVIYLGFMLTQGLHRVGVKRIRGWKFHYWYLWTGMVIIAGNFIIKNILRIGFGVMM